MTEYKTPNYNSSHDITAQELVRKLKTELSESGHVGDVVHPYETAIMQRFL